MKFITVQGADDQFRSVAIDRVTFLEDADTPAHTNLWLAGGAVAFLVVKGEQDLLRERIEAAEGA